jgi:hypothetical protein
VSGHLHQLAIYASTRRAALLLNRYSIVDFVCFDPRTTDILADSSEPFKIMREFLTMSEESLTYWQDILTEVMNGRDTGHQCPYCEVGDVAVENARGQIKLTCLKCGQYIEGRF